MEYVDDSDASFNWSTWDGPQRIGKGVRTVVNQRKNGDLPDNSIVKIGPEILGS